MGSSVCWVLSVDDTPIGVVLSESKVESRCTELQDYYDEQDKLLGRTGIYRRFVHTKCCPLEIE